MQMAIKIGRSTQKLEIRSLVVETITQVPATVSQCTGLYVHSESDCTPFEVGYIRIFIHM